MEREVAGVSSTALCRLPARRGRALRPERGRGLSAGDGWCRRVTVDQRVPARASCGVTAARRWFAPGLLRQTAPRLAWHPVDLAQPRPRVGPGAALDATGGRARAALPPGRRVVAP